MIIITDARPEDLDGIYEVEVNSFERPYPKGLLKFYLVMTPETFVVAKDDGKVVGYAVGVLQWGSVGHVVSIAVLKEYRRKGIGRALLEELESRLIRLGAKYFILETSVNWEAKKFYFASGYLAVRFLKSYYSKNEHALLMMKPAKNYTDGFE
ncbi:MAG: GNAT family N-acetyltransferase [Thermoprotei archaeon]